MVRITEPGSRDSPVISSNRSSAIHKPYIKSNSNNPNDAHGICEAMSPPTMRFVPVKRIEQQDIQAVCRVYASLVERGTAKARAIRG